MCIWQQKLVLINTLSIEYSSEYNEYFALQRNSFFLKKTKHMNEKAITLGEGGDIACIFSLIQRRSVT